MSVQPQPLAVARTLRGLTQDELAALAGVSRWTISAVERCKVRPSLETLEALGAALGVDREDLRPGTPDLEALKVRA